MANFFKYHAKVFCRAWKDSNAPVNKILANYGMPERGMLKIAIFVSLISGVITYYTNGELLWSIAQLQAAAINALCAFASVFLWFGFCLLMTPSRIDKEQETTISTLTEEIQANKRTKAVYDKLVKYRKLIVDEYINHLLQPDPEDEGYRKVYFKLDILMNEIANHVTTYFSPYHGAKIATLGELYPKFNDPVKKIAAEINVRLEEILRIYDPSPPPMLPHHPSAQRPSPVAG